MNPLSFLQTNRKVRRRPSGRSLSIGSSISIFTGLAACGGDREPGVSGADGTVIIQGRVLKGPLYNALVFQDLNDDGVLAENEPHGFTNEDGFFSIQGNNSLSKLISIGTENTIDASSASTTEGLRLVGVAGSKVLSPFSTLLETGLIDNESINILAGSTRIEFHDYDYYGPSVPNSVAIDIEKLAHQLQNLIEGTSIVLQSTGYSEADGLRLAASAVANSVSNQNGTLESITDSGLNEVLLEQIKPLIDDRMLKTGSDPLIVMDDVLNAILNVNLQIDRIESLTGSQSINVFSLSEMLSADIRAGVNSGAEINFSTSQYAEEQAKNAAPILLNISSNVISENTQDPIVGRLSASDDDGAVSFSIRGSDGGYFEIVNQNIVKLIGVANYEEKSVYDVIIVASDRFGKSSSTNFKISVRNENDENNGLIAIFGKPEVGELLTVDMSEFFDEDEISGDYHFSWYKDDRLIDGEAMSQYRLTSDDVGAVISVKVHYNDVSGHQEEVRVGFAEPIRETSLKQEVSVLTDNLSVLRFVEGDQVTLSVYFNPSADSENVFSYQNKMQFDSDELEYVAGSTNSNFFGVINIDDAESGQIFFGAISMAGLTDFKQALFEVSFVDKNDFSETEIIFSDFMLNGFSLDVEALAVV